MGNRNHEMRKVVGIGFSHQEPLLEHRSFGENLPKWILWLSYNPNRDAGTYLVLNEDGSVLRETLYPDGAVDCVVIKPQSFKRGSKREVPKS